jgi:hypothetical protein
MNKIIFMSPVALFLQSGMAANPVRPCPGAQKNERENNFIRSMSGPSSDELSTAITARPFYAADAIIDLYSSSFTGQFNHWQFSHLTKEYI